MESQRREGWRIKAWCAPDVRIISEALVFKLWREGKGPRRVRVGGATIITESHGEYLARVRREAAEALLSKSEETAYTKS
jgi:hypothetical protein